MTLFRTIAPVALLFVGACAHQAPIYPNRDTVGYAYADQHRREIEGRKDALLSELATCESGGDGDSPTPIVGGRGAYIGRFQFAPRTVINYVRDMDGRVLSYQEAVSLAHDYGQASRLAKYVIFERDGIAAWPACARKLGLFQRVADIKAASS
ncbi:MAG TPA: hypothetical protein VMI56_00445 [Reyranella sp.]|nr:hypothetical protein [Reyranella sp.]